MPNHMLGLFWHDLETHLGYRSSSFVSCFLVVRLPLGAHTLVDIKEAFQKSVFICIYLYEWTLSRIEALFLLIFQAPSEDGWRGIENSLRNIVILGLLSNLLQLELTETLVLPLVIGTKWLLYADVLYLWHGQFQRTLFHGSIPRVTRGNILYLADLGWPISLKLVQEQICSYSHKPF